MCEVDVMIGVDFDNGEFIEEEEEEEVVVVVVEGVCISDAWSTEEWRELFCVWFVCVE